MREKFGDIENEFKQATGYGYEGSQQVKPVMSRLESLLTDAEIDSLRNLKKAKGNTNSSTTQREVKSNDKAFGRTST